MAERIINDWLGGLYDGSLNLMVDGAPVSTAHAKMDIMNPGFQFQNFSMGNKCPLSHILILFSLPDFSFFEKILQIS